MGPQIKQKSNVFTRLQPNNPEGFLPYILWLPTLGFLLVIVIYPIYYLAKNSMYHSNPMNPHRARFVGLDNFVNAITNTELVGILQKTAVFVASSLALEMLLGIGLALLVSQYITYGQSIYKLLLISPMMMTPVAVGLIWRWLFNSDMGIINYFLNALGLDGISWLGSGTTALLAIIIVEVWQWTPFVFLGMLAGLTSLPQDPYEAAMVDGAGSWKRFVNITLPLVSPVLAVVLVFRFVDLFKAFDIIYVLTEGGPGNSTEILTFHIYKQAFSYFNTGYASAISWILLIFIGLICTWIMKRIIKQQLA